MTSLDFEEPRPYPLLHLTPAVHALPIIISKPRVLPLHLQVLTSDTRVINIGSTG